MCLPRPCCGTLGDNIRVSSEDRIGSTLESSLVSVIYLKKVVGATVAQR